MIRIKIIILAFFFLSSIDWNATAQQVTFSGPIEYKYIKTKTATGSGNEGYNWNVDIDEKYIIEGTFYVVFTAMGSPGGFTMCHMTSVEEEVFNFENSINNKASEERISQGCSDDRMKSKRTVTPGDSRIYKQTVEHVRLDPKKPCIGQGTMTIISPNSNGKQELSGGKYSVMLGGVIETEMTSEVYSEQKFACNPDRNAPPNVVSQTLNMPIPVSIVFEEDFDGSDVLTGRKVLFANHKTNCGPGSPYANMTHGEVDCAFDERIEVSWTLIKRTPECTANLSGIKGNVKINGVPVGNGEIKIGAGDMVSTGGKSRIRIATSDGAVMAVGSNSRLILSDPCNLAPSTESHVNPVRAWLMAVNWKIGIALGKTYEWRFDVGVGLGVRGLLVPPIGDLFVYNGKASDFLSIANNGFPNEVIEVDPEKDNIIKELGDLSGHEIVFYIHSDSEGIYDVSAIKGDIEVESTDFTKKMVVIEGTTVTSWPDGSPFAEIFIRANKDK